MGRFSRATFRNLAFLSVAAAIAAPAIAMYAMPSNAPVTRLLATLNKITAERPKDAKAFFMLGRVHSMAFAHRARELPVWDRRDNGDIPDVSWERGYYERKVEPPLTSTELLKHASESVKHLQHAIELDGKDARFHLSYAYALDQGALMGLDAEHLPTAPGKPAPTLTDARKKELQAVIDRLSSKDEKDAQKAQDELTKSLDEATVLLREKRDAIKGPAKGRARQVVSRYWLTLARAQYAKAFSMTVATEKKETKEHPVHHLISYEAGNAILKLDAANPPESKEDKENHEQVAATIKHFDNLPPQSWITPIIIPLTDKTTELSDLTDEAASVPFDLDGTARPQRWSWVKPSAGLLFWNPTGTGLATSGRDLFGSVTWWVLPDDGFTALDLLDDSRDGWLSGSELTGLSVWIDINSDGTCAPAEVVSLASLGIERLATRADSMTGDALTASGGVRLKDGRVRPMYDWMAVSKPVPAAKKER